MDMQQMMNNPQMMAMVQRLMSDPEVSALMMQPGMMQKVQQLMPQIMSSGNPQLALQSIDDPDLKKLISKLTALQTQDAQTYGMPSFNNSTAPASGEQHVVTIRNAQHFHEVVGEAGPKKLVVMDFSASWCGPCKRIAPVYAQIASENANTAIFCKIDGDANRDLVQQQEVKGFPTFQFWVNGSKMESFSGADEARLRSTCASYISDLNREPPCPYKHFPLKDTELVVYKDCKWSAVEKMLLKHNDTFAESKSPNHLSHEELGHMKSLAASLADPATYHMYQIPAEQLETLTKVLFWPLENVAPALHYLRIAVRHPSAAKHFAKNIESTTENNVLLRLCRVSTDCVKPTHGMLALRVVINMFGRQALIKALLLKASEALDLIASLVTNEDKKLRTTLVGVFLNYAITLYYRPGHEDTKVQLLALIMEHLGDEQDSTLLYRLVVVLGTLLYRDAGAKEMAVGMEIDAVVETKQDLGDAKLRECCEEVLKCLKDEEQ